LQAAVVVEQIVLRLAQDPEAAGLVVLEPAQALLLPQEWFTQ
jgi:hypothetical protein